MRIEVIGLDLHQKYYQNRIISRKFMSFSNGNVFCLTPLYNMET